LVEEGLVKRSLEKDWIIILKTSYIVGFCS